MKGFYSLLLLEGPSIWRNCSFTFYWDNIVGRGQLRPLALWSLACMHIKTGPLGVFCLYFLQYLELKKNSSIFPLTVLRLMVRFQTHRNSQLEKITTEKSTLERRNKTLLFSRFDYISEINIHISMTLFS